MQIYFHSDNHVELNEQSIERWQSDVSTSLKRFANWITRLEVHLTDENSHAKGGSDDIRCLMEARPASQQPVSVEVRAASLDKAVVEATGKLQRRLSHIMDKARTEQRKQH